MLLELAAAAVVGGGDTELQALEGDRKVCVLWISVAGTRGDVEWHACWLALRLVIQWPGGSGGGGCLPRDGNDLDGITFDGLCSAEGQLLGKDWNLFGLIGHDVAQGARQRDCASDGEEVAAVAGQLWKGLGWLVGRRFCEEEHALELSGKRD